MPSPVGHGLAGMLILKGARRWGVSDVPSVPAIVLATIAADFDFVPGILVGDWDRFHHGATHSLLAALLFGIGSGLVARLRGVRQPRIYGWLMGLAYLSHLLLDMLSTDSRAWFGVPAFWPFFKVYVNAPFDIFQDIRRDPLAANFFVSLLSRHNLLAVLRELLIVGGALTLFGLIARTSARPPAAT